MTVVGYIILGVILFCGSVIQSATGFAFGLFSISLLLLATPLEPYAAIVMISTCSLMQSVFGLTAMRGSIKWRKLLPLIVVAVCMQPFGVWVLSLIRDFGAERIRQTFGVILLATLTFQWFFKPKPKEHVHPAWGWFAFGLGGFLSGLCGMGGPPMVIWLMAHTWTNKQTRAALWLTFALLGPTNLIYQSLRFGPDVWKWVGIAVLFLPIVLLGMVPGLWLGNRMGKERLRTIAFALLVVIAAWLILEPMVMTQ